ncbi:MAG: hypothetical protein LKE64_11005 [Solobacterium sp.]|jgi:hypothetical protein|nr:hypothetical protein [Solobacterium sp.]MCH4048247.1 hypothetical protein [Solobacterium sp.]MCH4074899.1 hypothetical protein [Solobacterium sp.]MCI1314009.1 hypothetical protein [Solobacterium sp.]MCI1346098.1 hypothetical protein [Solobacterium sp.]
MSDHDTYLQLLFTAAANLYGEITMHELWDIYLQLKEKGMAREKIHKKDILAFAAEKKIENTVYDFFEEDELYTEEERNPDRLRVVNKAIMKEGDFENFYTVDELRDAFEPAVPDDFWQYGGDEMPQQYNALYDWIADKKAADGPFTDADGDTYTPAYPGKMLKEIRKRSQKEIKDEVPREMEKFSALDRIMLDIYLDIQVGRKPIAFIVSDTIAAMESHGVNLRSNDVNRLSRLLFDLFLKMPAWCLYGNTMEGCLDELAVKQDPRFEILNDKNAAMFLCADLLVHPYDEPDDDSGKTED